MVEVVKTNVDDIPLSETSFEGIVKPLVTEEALALANKHGFRLESDLANPVIGLVKDKRTRTWGLLSCYRKSKNRVHEVCMGTRRPILLLPPRPLLRR